MQGRAEKQPKPSKDFINIENLIGSVFIVILITDLSQDLDTYTVYNFASIS